SRRGTGGRAARVRRVASTLEDRIRAGEVMADRLDLFPIVVVEDRYSGTYSGGNWTAAPRGLDLLDSDAMADDTSAAVFWARHEVTSLDGGGATPDAAVEDLLLQTA